MHKTTEFNANTLFGMVQLSAMPVGIINVSGSSAGAAGVARVLPSGPAIVLEPSPAFLRKGRGGRRTMMRLAFMADDESAILCVVLRAGRHVILVALDCGGPTVQQLLRATLENKHLRVASIGEPSYIDVYDLTERSLALVARHLERSPMDASGYLGAAADFLAQVSQPGTLAELGIDPRRLRSLSMALSLVAPDVEREETAECSGVKPAVMH